ncbi:MAG: sulfotransferase domain-containing protein [Candidatus Hydrogenedentes bacterium]|nr:sulfotransferase domain-containing protein [Candidatus Hydrogenedentota bacterium]
MTDRPPFLINAFPKSGTHLVAQICRPLAEPNPTFAARVGLRPLRYIATHDYGGWGIRFRQVGEVLSDLALLEENQFGAGHLAAMEYVIAWIEKHSVPMIFVYRDLRDIAVSETYHIEAPKDFLYHPYKKKFNRLADHQERLRAVICGYDGYPGLRFRWEQYAAWLDFEWILPVRFRDARLEPKQTAQAILGYLEWRTGIHYDEGFVDLMVKSITPSGSPTFRKGRVGDWKEEFDEETGAAAERELGDWTRELGFDGEG